MNVLLIGHACGPRLGSEPGNTWNWAQYLSRRHRVWVITHPQHQSKINAFLVENPNPNLKFVWVTLRSPIDPWNPEDSERGIRIHYLIWLSKAYERAVRLCDEIALDIAHHVSWATISAPPPLWRLPIPAVWGPVGGGQSAPPAFLRYFGSQTWKELLRTFRVNALRFYPMLRKTLEVSKLTFAVNNDTKRLLKSARGVRLEQFLDCGLAPEYIPADLPQRKVSGEFTLLWAGRLEPHKALTLALRALARVEDDRVKLLVAGAGYLRTRLEKQVNRLHLEARVKFLGFVPYQNMPALFRRCDAFLFTSLRDSFGAVVLEAMAYGLPTLTLDHQGVGDFIPSDAGIKVPVTAPEETINALAQAIRRLATSDRQREMMSVAAWNFAKAQAWDLRAERMSQIYEEVLAAQAPHSSPVQQLEELRQI